MKRGIILLALFLFPFLALSLQPLSQLRQLLEKEKSTRWMGRQLYSLTTRRGVLKIEAIVKSANSDKTRLEFIAPSPFAGYVMIWKEESGVIIPPRGKRMPLPRFAPAEDMRGLHIELLSKSAKVSLKGEEKLLGRTAKVFLIEPAYVKGGYLKLWIDKETGIRLKTERYSPQGKLVSMVYLLSLQLNPPLKEKEFAVPKYAIDSQNYSPKKLQHILGFRVLLPSYLPPGYTVLHIRPLLVGKQRAVTIHLTDGLNPITIMEVPHPWKHPPLGSGYEQELVSLTVKGYGVVLTGNVDRKVLKNIGLSLE